MFLRCIDCIVERLREGKTGDSFEFNTVSLASLAVSTISGNAVCSKHLEKRLKDEGIKSKG